MLPEIADGAYYCDRNGHKWAATLQGPLAMHAASMGLAIVPGNGTGTVLRPGFVASAAAREN